MSATSDPWLDLAVNLVGTLLGVLSAFILGTSYERYKAERTDKSDKIRVLTAIKEELTLNSQIIHRVDRPPPEQWRALSRIALDSAVNSGRFQLLTAPVQSKLAETYLELDNIQQCAREYFQILPSGGDVIRSAEIRRSQLIAYISIGSSRIETLIPETINVLSSSLTAESR